MPVTKSALVDLAIVLGLILIGIIGYLLSSSFRPQADVTITPDPACDLHQQACAVSLPGGGQLRLGITPRPVPVMQPLEVSVELFGTTARAIMVDFSGVTMYMGLNQAQLREVAPGRFAGKLILPSCVTGRMAWQATVWVEAGTTRYAVPFRFDAG